jgi:hypothetical protein
MSYMYLSEWFDTAFISCPEESCPCPAIDIIINTRPSRCACSGPCRGWTADSSFSRDGEKFAELSTEEFERITSAKYFMKIKKQTNVHSTKCQVENKIDM